jgi:putative (di)nucleoside polyphosphate hydrolase
MSQGTDPNARRVMSPEEINRLPYRAGVGVMLFNRAGRIFVAQRIDMRSEAWQMPQGGIDAGESPRQAALRELYEEVGTDEAEIIAESRDWFRYDLPAELIPKLWDGRFRGQEQKWYAARFLGSDDDIDIETEVPEFRAWRWAEMTELPDLIVPFKRRIYEDLVKEFGHLAEVARTG